MHFFTRARTRTHAQTRTHVPIKRKTGPALQLLTSCDQEESDRANPLQQSLRVSRFEPARRAFGPGVFELHAPQSKGKEQRESSEDYLRENFAGTSERACVSEQGSSAAPLRSSIIAGAYINTFTCELIHDSNKVRVSLLDKHTGIHRSHQKTC